MIYIIDGFEGNYVVCEKSDKTIVNIEREKVPSDAKEGDVIKVIKGMILLCLKNSETNILV